MITVILLIVPFAIFSNPFVCLGVTLCMAGISLGIAGLSFLIGILIKQFIGVDLLAGSLPYLHRIIPGDLRVPPPVLDLRIHYP
ncbi:MAG: hypothetical protein B6241_13955 [Spirochaetaceae bacterium 4572_59]|nr:MAG: hypothetical protein B6241_13955 [Spirochaetaceae bacterium 4572_59]